jgi:hypothetical protein
LLDRHHIQCAFDPRHQGIDIPTPTWFDALQRCAPSSFLNR